MNPRQRQILVTVGVVIVLMLAFPPYAVRGGNNMISVVLLSGYAFLFDLPPRATVEVGTLLLQWLAVLIIGAIAFVLAKDAKPAQHWSMREALRKIDHEGQMSRSASEQRTAPPAKNSAQAEWPGVLGTIAAMVGWYLYMKYK